MVTIDTRTIIWKVSSIIGICLTAVGLSAGYFDEATKFRFSFLSSHFDLFLEALLLGIGSSFISFIGWAGRSKTRTWKRRAAGLVFVSPWIAGMLGYPIEGFNVHGPSALLYFLVVPAASILALVLFIMADYSKQN